MVKVQTGNELGTAILKVLGIEVKGVTRIGIDCGANEMATVSIGRVVYDQEAGKLLEVLDTYILERKPEVPDTKALETVARNLVKG